MWSFVGQSSGLDSFLRVMRDPLGGFEWEIGCLILVLGRSLWEGCACMTEKAQEDPGVELSMNKSKVG